MNTVYAKRILSALPRRTVNFKGIIQYILSQVQTCISDLLREASVVIVYREGSAEDT